MYKRRVLLLCCFCVWTLTQAQQSGKKHLSIEGGGSFGKMAKIDSKIKEVLRKNDIRFYDLSLHYNTLPSDSCHFASAYNYPVLGLGLSVADFSSVRLTNQSRINTIYALYGFIDRSIIRKKRLNFGYKLSAGLAYTNNPYDPDKNPDNIFISSPLMVYVGFGFNVKFRLIDRLAIGLNAEFRHISNGRLGMPNKGINVFSAGLSVIYHFDAFLPDFPQTYQKEEYKKHFYYHFVLSGGIQSSIEEWNLSIAETDPGKQKKEFQKYPKLSLSADVMYRYSCKFGSGIGLDLFYTPHAGKFKEWDVAFLNGEPSEQKYSPLSVGIAFNQEIFYKNVSLLAAVGCYLYRKLGVQNEEKFYQRAGFRYYFPLPENTIFLGIAIKAHKFTIADYLEFSVGYKFQ